MENNIRYLMIAQGRVQHVGFRNFCKLLAMQNNITGYVKNLDNDMVQIEAQGTKENIDNFIILIKKGNIFIRVDDLSIKKIQLKEEEINFKILY